MRPVSDRSFQPVAWPQDPLNSQHGRKEEQPVKAADPVEETDPTTDAAQVAAQVVPKIALALYDNKGVMRTEEADTGQNLDLKA